VRVVILTMDGIEHCYVTDALAAGLGNALKAVVIAEPAPRPFWTRWRSYFRRYSVGQVGSRVAAKLYGKWLRKGEHKTETYRRMLDAALASTPSWSEIRYTVASHNGAECQELIQAHPARDGSGTLRSRGVRRGDVTHGTHCSSRNGTRKFVPRGRGRTELCGQW